MKFLPFVAILSIALPLMSLPACGKTPAPFASDAESSTYATHIPDGYHLVFSDEFDVAGAPDPWKWAYDTRQNKQGWNSEKQYYAANRTKNARIENGHLIIEAHKERLSDMADWGGQAYSSARVTTKDKKGWTYGFYDIRAKLPCATGTWPAIWLLTAPPKWKWPENGEIDIMEMIGWDANKVHGSLHTQATERDKIKQTSTVMVANSCSAFHSYQVDWQPERITFMVDNVPYYSVDKKDADYDHWPFDHDHYLILNVAVGGNWGGKKGIDDTAFPQRMEVDYVRIYQK